MDQYPSNSHSSSAPKPPPKAVEDKKIVQITTGEVVRKKRSLGKRIRETFMGGDAKGAWAYIVGDVLIPAARDMIVDASTQGVERVVFGESRSSSRRGGSRSAGPNGYVPYNRPSAFRSGGAREEPRNMSRRARATHDFDEIILASRVEADAVLDQLSYLIEKYETATVADLYEMVNLAKNFTDDKWGWSNMENASVSRVRNGYLLNLPAPEPVE